MSFLPFLVSILKETDYVDVASVEKCHSEWSVLDDKDTLKAFLNWFINCITHENCLTTDEVAIYCDLKSNNKLVPNDELDLLLTEYFSVELSDNISKADIKHSIAVAELELLSLESLEGFLNGHEKKLEKNKKEMDDLSPFIKSELKDLEMLNICYNEALNKYTHAWEDLKVQLSQENSNELSLNKHLNMIFLNNKINQNLNEHLQNYFQQIKPTDGIMPVSSMDYWILNKKLSEVRNEIIHTTAAMNGKSIIINYLKELERIISIDPADMSLPDINKYLSEVPDFNEKLTEILSTTLEDEVNCLMKIQINDTKKCSAFQEDRYGRLCKIENILQNKSILNEAFIVIIKRDKVIRDYQLDVLNQHSKNIESLVSQYEQRIERMKNYKNTSNFHCLDSNYKAMMKNLGLQTSDYKALSTEVANFKERLNTSYINLKENLNSFQNKFTERLNKIKRIDKMMNDGPTRELFDHNFNNHITDLKGSLKRRRKTFESFIKIQKMLEELKNKSGNEQCIWIKCLENPKCFLRTLEKIEEETERLMERLKIEL